MLMMTVQKMPSVARGRAAMARLISSAITSLDGFVADDGGDFGWAAPDEEVHAFVNGLERPIGTYLNGRRMYEVMVGWGSPRNVVDRSPVVRDFAAIWQVADKIVYSTTLAAASGARTRIERDFDPEAVRRMTAAADRDITVDGDLARTEHEDSSWQTSSRRSTTTSVHSPMTNRSSSRRFGAPSAGWCPRATRR